MALIDAREIPADPTSAARLADRGLDYRVVDPTDASVARGFHRAVARGFLGADPTEESLEYRRVAFATRRMSGVYDAAVGATPVATVDSWVTPLTVPGGACVDMWAISAVTVAGTHRRRGIARALLEGELRAAAYAGMPMAGLTVTEATLYGRYGFGAAVPVARFAVDTRTAGWGGYEPTGRIEYVEREALAVELGAVHERARLTRAGRVPGWKARWEEHAGLAPYVTDGTKVRGVRYLDAAGEVRGVMAYRLTENEAGFRHRLEISLMVGETPDAVAALWRFAVQHDLVDEVTADLRPIDDPLPWLVANHRGATQTVHDHQWLRILDVPAALTARTYAAPLDVVIRVNDSLGFASGDWRLQVDGSGEATVTAVSDSLVDATMDVSTLAIIYAGGVRAASVRAAGLLESDAATAESIDRAFVAFPVPSLDIWY